MSNNNLLILIILIFLSCSQDENREHLPDCIAKSILLPNVWSELDSVRRQEFEGVFHYWLDTGLRHGDIPELIVNDNCETVCIICFECIPPDCMFQYDQDNWETIWP